MTAKAEVDKVSHKLLFFILNAFGIIRIIS
jgi:hypothetical protein